VKILRTIVWGLAATGFLIFAVYNWQPVELTLWQNLVLETKVPVLALLAFAAGFLPMWAVHRSVVWGQTRRIRTLENSLKNTAMAHLAEPPIAAIVADSPVDNRGKGWGEPANPLSPSPDANTDSGSARE
jgi:lipopolysaccharide assembly protein A